MMEGQIEHFLDFSSAVTGFDTFDLAATGQAEAYLGAATSVVGDTVISELLERYTAASRNAGGDEAALERSIRRDILSDEKLGPVARHLIKLWYVGTWYELPKEWHERFGASDRDRTWVISAASYMEGLLWPAVGANPSGAKPFGYGIWATPPRIPRLD